MVHLIPIIGTPGRRIKCECGARTLNAKLKLFWVSCGDKDRGLEGAKRLDQALTDKKINHVWHQDTGAHEWPVWKNDLYLVAQKLFKNS